MSCSYFYKWLFGAEMFSGPSRNALQSRKEFGPIADHGELKAILNSTVAIICPTSEIQLVYTVVLTSTQNVLLFSPFSKLLLLHQKPPSNKLRKKEE